RYRSCASSSYAGHRRNTFGITSGIAEHAKNRFSRQAMFTGLVQSLAEVIDIIPEPPGVRLVICESRIAAESKTGDSIAINGCCLPLVGIDDDRLSFQAGEETLSRTNLGELLPGAMVNLEQSL